MRIRNLECWSNETGKNPVKNRKKIPTLPISISLQPATPRLELGTPSGTEERYNRYYAGTRIVKNVVEMQLGRTQRKTPKISILPTTPAAPRHELETPVGTDE